MNQIQHSIILSNHMCACVCVWTWVSYFNRTSLTAFEAFILQHKIDAVFHVINDKHVHHLHGINDLLMLHLHYVKYIFLISWNM